MKSMLKDAAILLIITLIAGFALGFVYDITKVPIALAHEDATKAAYMIVFHDAESFAGTESIFPYPKEGGNAAEIAEWNEAGFSDVEITGCQEAYDLSGARIGYVLLVTTHAGYGGDISFAMGIRNDKTLNGISILEISETAGLGMKAPEVLVPQFKKKKVAEFLVTKTGAGSDAEIDAISGATITSKAVTNAVNAGLYYFETVLGGGADAE